MRILVLGGAGYIGSHTVAELITQGHEAVVVDTLEKGHRRAVHKDAVFYQGDLRDESLMDRVFTENSIDAVIDFAAYSLVGESVTDPLKYYDNNVNGMLRLLRSMNRHNVNKVVFSSTAATYGVPEHVPLVETDKTEPINPYGETKLAVEKMLKWADGAYGIRYAALRYFNVAGAHKSGALGEDHNPESHLIPIVLQAALGQREFIDVYGNDYATPDGTCIRDYIHVTDLAEAHILAVKMLAEGGGSTVFNLGNGKGFSNMEIIKEAERVTGLKISIRYAPRRQGDPDILIASSDKISRELGWKPKHAELTDIIRSAYVWHKNNPNGYGRPKNGYANGDC